MDLVIIAPGNNKVIYQSLARTYAALEPPLWAGLLANAIRKKNFQVAIIDQEALGLSSDGVVSEALEYHPQLVAIVVYGQQPSASTQNMTMAQEICEKFYDAKSNVKTILLGVHPSALPEQTLQESKVDFVCQGEGLQTIETLLTLDNCEDGVSLQKVPGLWFRDGKQLAHTTPAPLIPQTELATVLPGVAWDLLPMKQYRAHNWHCFENIAERMPYASIYTSLGCPFQCSFCCINAPFEKHRLRCWNPHFVIQELEILARDYNIKNLKIADEMFVLNEKHVLTLCDLIIERGYDFNIWAYARVDTVKDIFLEKMRKAGVRWLCLGIESKSKYVRDGVEKGRYTHDNIYQTVRKIQNSGINVLGNYIFGLPDDTYESMQDNLDMALELNCEWANFYCAMAYPGSKLYSLAIAQGWQLPRNWHDFSQHSIEMLPLPTQALSAGEIISFRDQAWDIYFKNPRYLDMVRSKFGEETYLHVLDMTTIKLNRKYCVPIKQAPAATV
ncbi:MAG: cobalamin B12-binding domain-containing protein [Deltaproteobacteria bacterium]|nr:cobalamin B12-binding domain-containing protein [Deltaproteobacteria bacterium]